MATVWGVVGLDVAVQQGLPGPQGTGRNSRGPGIAAASALGFLLQPVLENLGEQRELLNQIIKARMFYNAKVRVGRVSNPVRESSQLVPSPTC